MKKHVVSMIVILMFAALKISAQSHPPLPVGVTFYDFHSDTSCPEFERTPYPGGAVHTGMLQPTLDADSKPLPTTNSANIYFNQYIKYWFRDWRTSSKGDSTRPIYQRNGQLTAINPNYHTDTSFKNIVFDSTINFTYNTGNGMYEYVKSDFFPLDGRGFGSEKNNHNYSFTMELHWRFTKQSGMRFEFTGDDDVWCFINGKLEMDIGGIHGPETKAFNLDTVPGIDDGDNCRLDFFYAERHITGSNIKITTNIITPIPREIQIKVMPDSSICAGDTLTAISTVFDQDSVPQQALSDSTVWSFVNSGGNAPSTLFPNIGQTVRFVPTEAFDTVKIQGAVTKEGKTISKIIAIYVRACHPDHLVIEAVPPPPNSRNDSPLDKLRISSNQKSASAYAIIRDKFGNYIDCSQITSWSITRGDTIIDKVTPGNQTIGEGIVFKKSNKNNGEGEVRADNTQYGSPFWDVVNVVVDSVTYDSLKILTMTPGGALVKIDSLFTTTDRCTTLYVQGKRSDGLGWEAVDGTWSASISPNYPPPPRSPSPHWDYCAEDTGHGSIGVSFGGKSKSIKLTVGPGGPAKLVLFDPATGDSFPNIPTISNSIQAGSQFPLYAKVFDSRGVFLTQFDNASAPEIGWSFQLISGTSPIGSLSASQGNQNTFTPIRAYNVVQIKAVFNGGLFGDSVRIRIIPGPPDHITIQYDTSTNFQDLKQITFGSTDTSQLLYPIIRDKNENFIEIAEMASWSSKDTSVVTAEATSNIFSGEGKVTRVTDTTRNTYVMVSDKNDTLKDSVRIFLTNITYDSLRIFDLDNGPKYIDTITIRTDESDTLWVEGHRSDGKGWENIPATWHKIGNLKFVIDSLKLSDNLRIAPDSAGIGKIYVSKPGAVGDTVVAVFLPGLPNSINIYKQEGNPASLRTYLQPPLVDTFTAGTTYPLVAKIFDRKGIWLSNYENTAVSKTLFSWSITKLSGEGTTDTLNSRTSHKISFTPYTAYNTYRITVEFHEGTKSLSASADFYVKPSVASQLVIEGNPIPSGIYKSDPNPLDIVRFDNRDTIKLAYAILRDAYGNFVSQSQSTFWESRDISKVTANEGTSSIGEGRMVRTGSLGQTYVRAENRNNPLLFDSVLVELTNFSYDSLRIVVNDSIDIRNLKIKTNEDTLLQVLGKRSYDGQWVPVDGNWVYNSSNLHMSSPASQAWNFAPSDTGTGKIIVTRGASVPDTVNVTIISGAPAKLALYAKGGQPDAGNPPYPDPAQAIVAVAGHQFPLYAKVFDQNKIWLKEYETVAGKSAQITWEVIELGGKSSLGTLEATAGYLNHYFPIKAYDSVYVVAHLQYDPTHLYSDTVLLDIKPDVAKQLVLEGTPNWRASPNAPNPVGTVQINDSVTSASVFAVLRDSLGNYVQYANVSTWGVVNNDTLVSVRSGNTNIGEGVIERNFREGQTKVFAIDINGFRDTADVQLLPYYFKKLRILVKTKSGFDTLESITMTTNDDTLLKVQGLRSDNDIWADLAAKWENSPSLNAAFVNPGQINSWTLSPVDTGRGWIRVTMGNDRVTLPDTLSVIILPGPPVKAVIEILTPPDQRIAGEQIITVVKIYNKDGRLVQGDFCFNKDSGNEVKYTDTIGIGGKPKPFVIIEGDTVFLTNESSQCFNSGVDTVPLVLYNVPNGEDNQHQITANLGDLKAISSTFPLLPAKLDSLALENPDGTPVGDTILLNYPKGQLTIYSVGYDRFGNRIGYVESDWSTDSTLHPIFKSEKVSRIYYDASEVKDNESGNISATPSDSLPWITAHTFVKIIGPLTKLTNVITRDLNGNGFLDHIELHFSKPITLPKGFMFDNINLTKHGADLVFTVDSIEGTGRTDSVWIIAFSEQKGSKDKNGEYTPQTKWDLDLSYDGNKELEFDSTYNKMTLDGAGPVIWSVEKQIVNLDDRSQDIVTVKFSEPIQQTDGSSLRQTDAPFVMFYVWEKDSKDSSKFILVDSMFAGIQQFESINQDGVTVAFLTYNNKDLTSRHFLTINTDTLLITDKADPSNSPIPENQKVRVKVVGPPPKHVQAFPNPAVPTFEHQNTNPTTYYANAVEWAKRGGMVLRINFVFPKESGVKMKLTAKIYDLVGNQVYYSKNDDILTNIPSSARPVPDSQSVFYFTSYWNGICKSGMKAAPGVYQLVMYLEYWGSNDAKKYNRDLENQRNQPFVEKIGIRR